jgi:hypothetical protein
MSFPLSNVSVDKLFCRSIISRLLTKVNTFLQSYLKEIKCPFAAFVFELRDG